MLPVGHPPPAGGGGLAGADPPARHPAARALRLPAQARPALLRPPQQAHAHLLEDGECCRTMNDAHAKICVCMGEGRFESARFVVMAADELLACRGGGRRKGAPLSEVESRVPI